MAAPESPPPVEAPPPRRRGEGDVALTAFLVLLLASAVLGWPLRDAGAERVVTALRLAALAVGVVAIAPNRIAAALAAVAALVVGFAQAAGGDRGHLELGSRIAFYGVVASALLGRVFRPGRVTVHRLLGAVSVYVLLAVAWGTAYQLLVVLDPGAIEGQSGTASLDQAMWLSFVTITTTGYGDVLPASGLARSLAALEALVGVLYPAILISRLVSLVQAPARAGGEAGGKADP